MNGTVVAICIAGVANRPMREVPEVEAIAGQGLKGDRYATGEGSFNRNKRGDRQVTLMNAKFFPGSGFTFAESRRNIFTRDVELMRLIGREFQIGKVLFRGVEYCEPCRKPSRLAGIEHQFSEVFFDRGGLIAEVVRGGIIQVGAVVVPPPKGY